MGPGNSWLRFRPEPETPLWSAPLLSIASFCSNLEEPPRSWRSAVSGGLGVTLIELIVTIAVMILPISATAQTIGTLTLDSLSFISFGDQQTISLPAGSTLEFQFRSPNATGSIPFTISPSGLSILPVDLPGDAGSLLYGLAGAAIGVVIPTNDGHIIQFNASVTATLQGQDGQTGTYTYSMPFTTETAVASDILGQTTVERTGVRLVEGIWYVQIVAATTNKENAFPAPGTAVYSVLSGQFDQLPIGQ